MGGSIDLESTPGAGSTFRFTAVFADAGPGIETQPSNGNEAVPPGRPICVLLAEDNPVNQRLVRQLLEKTGHSVDIVATGTEAVARAAGQGFDLILMDVQMPDLDGFEATRLIRARENGENHVPIYAFTAHALRGDDQRCIEAGMDGYLAKPVRPEQLLNVVNTVAQKTPAPAQA